MKMKYISIIAGVVAILTINACTDGFEEINTNPNRLTSTEPENLFGLSPVTTLRAIGGAPNNASRANNWFVFGNMSQLWSVVGGSAPGFSDDGAADALWNDLYSNSLKPLFNIIENYGDQEGYKNRVAVAKIWRSYVFSILVGLYGPLPYTDACNGDIEARFDTEEEIYLGILAELKEAYETINTANTADNYPPEAEPFLKGNLTRWQQFAHCIRLRTAMRIADCNSPAKAYPGKPSLQSLQDAARAVVVEELNHAENKLLITANTGNFAMTYDNNDLNTKNPLFFIVDQMAPGERKKQMGNLPVPHESLMMWIKPDTYNDPVLDVYIKEGNGGTRARPVSDRYLGRPNNMSAPQNFIWPVGWVSPYAHVDDYANFATIGDYFLRSNAQYFFFSYAELCFIRAEATLTGLWTGGKSAEEYYYEGIDARCMKYAAAPESGINASRINTYKNSPGIKWSTPTLPTDGTPVVIGDVLPYLDYLGGFTSSLLGGPEDNLKRIIVQHWISLWTQNIDAWTLLRRTQVIPFKPVFGADQNGAYVGRDDNGSRAYLPERLSYPGRERSINTKQTQNAIQNYLYDNKLKNEQDRLTFRLIFAADQPGLPAAEMQMPVYNSFPYALPNLALNRQ